MTFLGVRKRREALAAAREDHRRERGASVLQKSFRNWSCRWRAEASRFEAQERLLTFAAGKLQAHWFRALAARLRREASLPLLPERTHGEATANVPRNEGSDNEGEVQVDDDEDDDDEESGKEEEEEEDGEEDTGKRSLLVAKAKGGADGSGSGSSAGGKGVEAARRRLAALEARLAASRAAVEAERERQRGARRLQRVFSAATADTLLGKSAAAARKASARASQEARRAARPVSLRLLSVKGVQGAGGTDEEAEEEGGGDLIVVVSALPSPPPPLCLVGSSEGKQPPTSTDKKRQMHEWQRAVAVSSPCGARRLSQQVKPRKSSSSSPHSPSPLSSSSAAAQSAEQSAEQWSANWNQDLELSGDEFDGHSLVVFTLLRRRPTATSGSVSSSSSAASSSSSSFSASLLHSHRDEFLGQTGVRLSDLPDLWRSGTGGGGRARQGVQKELRLGALKARVFDGRGRKLKLENKTCEGGARLQVTFRIQDNDATFGGWLMASAGPLSARELKKRAKEGAKQRSKQKTHDDNDDGSNDPTKGKRNARKNRSEEPEESRNKVSGAALKFVQRWVLLSGGKLFVKELPSAEPDLTVSLRALEGCHVEDAVEGGGAGGRRRRRSIRGGRRADHINDDEAYEDDDEEADSYNDGDDGNSSDHGTGLALGSIASPSPSSSSKSLKGKPVVVVLRFNKIKATADAMKEVAKLERLAYSGSDQSASSSSASSSSPFSTFLSSKRSSPGQRQRRATIGFGTSPQNTAVGVANAVHEAAFLEGKLVLSAPDLSTAMHFQKKIQKAIFALNYS